ncbi:macrophage-expressed gene 1 protein-like [Haliotis cracherodii]|uniref:macrophage-expressed gene 1 protein-like n=1 Tax=Haliotis cracherodii TaxID=6455 RepID=UPI0039ECE925
MLDRWPPEWKMFPAIVLLLSVRELAAHLHDSVQPVDRNATAKHFSQFPLGDPRACQSGKAERFEVLPGIGWDNLRNEDGVSVVVYNYSLCQTTLDGRFLLPDCIETLPRKTSKVNTYAEIISHYSDYESVTARSVNVDAGFSLFGVSIGGSFSDSFQHAKSQQIGDKTITTRVQLRYKRYTARLKDEVKLTTGFKFRLMEVANDLQGDRTQDARYKSQLLVRDFGTHYLRSVDAGATLVQEDHISSDYSESKDVTKTEMKIGASASFFGIFHFSTSYTSSSAKTAIEKYQKQRSSSRVQAFGGPEFKVSNYTANDWVSGVEKNLVAIDRQGDPIFYLITPANLPELPPVLVSETFNLVKEAVGLYYEFNTYRGCMKLDSPNFSPAANVDDGTCEMSFTNTSFGGVYQTCSLDTRSNNGDICSKNDMNQKNPKTGDYSCPIGYESIKIHTATLSTPKPNPGCVLCGFLLCCIGERYEKYRYSSGTYSLYWCAAKDRTHGNGYLFGGLYTSSILNPLTKSRSCPVTYVPRKIALDLNICISDDYELGAKCAVPFGGFYSCEAGNPLALNSNQKNVNSSPKSLRSFFSATETWPKRCPYGYSQHLADEDQGCQINYCVKSGSLSSAGLPRVRRPPFMPPPGVNSAKLYMIMDSKSKEWVRLEPDVNRLGHDSGVMAGAAIEVVAVTVGVGHWLAAIP